MSEFSKRLIVVLLGVIAITAVIVKAEPASAQIVQTFRANCVPVQPMKEAITKHGLQLSGGGLINQQMIGEFWRNPDTGGWMLLIIFTNGLACELASGSDWQERIILPGEPS